MATQALPRAYPDQAIHDVAKITGPVFDGAAIGFRAYRADPQLPVCDYSTLVFESPAGPVTEPRIVQSRSFMPDELGVYTLVATLYVPGGEILWTDECGNPAETTHVVEEPVELSWPVVMG